MSDTSHREKRRAPRDRHDSVLELFDKDGDLITGVGRLVNFSTIGACFASTQAFKIGARVRAHLRLLKEGRLGITGRIVWSRKKINHHLYGIEFDSIRRL